MATNDVNIAEDAEMAECDGDKVVTMMDVLQEQQDFEEDANAVLGASDDKNCTYSKGYIKRQALYACLTCCTEAKVDPTKRAGVCLACSLTCHENHELIELYTKRNFRCDCGNPKFDSHPCQFTPDKPDLNEDNIYNQNFSGLYCTCHRPYPDPESTFEDDMIQCIICEDWLHATHLEAVVPASDQYSEMICKNCMEKNEFLHDYNSLAVSVEMADVDILTVNGDIKSAKSLLNGDIDEKFVNGTEENKIEAVSIAVNGDAEMNEAKVKDDTHTNENKVADGTAESTDVKNEETKKPDDTNMELDIENKKAEQENKEKAAGTGDSNNEKDHKETSEDTTEQQSDKKLKTDEIISQTEAEKTDNTEQTETKEEISEEVGDGDKTQGSKTDTNEETEQQVLDNIKTLSDNATKEQTANTTSEEKPEESINKEDVKANNVELLKETSEEVSKSSGDKSVSDNKIGTDNIEVADTSQPEKDTKENSEVKTDSVMDAIDELLQTASEAKEKDNVEDSKEITRKSTKSEESANKLTDSKTTDNVETEESNEVEINTSENKLNNELPYEAETATKSESNTDVEMSDTKTDTDSKAAIETETSSITNESVATVNESQAGSNNKSEVSDTANESVSQENKALNETDKFKPIGENDSTNENKFENRNVTENAKDHKRKLSTDLTDVSPKKAKLECVRPKGVKRVHKGATFWPSNFRQKLCTCNECLSVYKDLNVLFLTDFEDTVFAYESLGKKNTGGASQYEKGLEALSSLDRIQQINALTEYNKMRDKLLDFLKSFKDRKEIVKEEDIKAFFAGMKPRREPDGVYFCR